MVVRSTASFALREPGFNRSTSACPLRLVSLPPLRRASVISLGRLATTPDQGPHLVGLEVWGLLLSLFFFPHQPALPACRPELDLCLTQALGPVAQGGFQWLSVCSSGSIPRNSEWGFGE